MLDGFDFLKQFIPEHKQSEIKDRIIDTLARAFPNEHWRKLIQAYRSDAAFQDSLATALKRVVKKFASDYADREVVVAMTQGSRFWDTPSVQSALQEIITRPSSYLQPERNVIFHSFADVLPTFKPDRVQQAVQFFLTCLTREVINIPQLAPIYQVQLQWATLEQSHQLVGLQRDQNQLITALIETVTQNQRLLAAPAKAPRANHNLPSLYGVFLGRDQDIARVLEGLEGRWPLISIAGMAGMGKTTLAIEIAHRCLAGPKGVLNPPFEYVVWVSAKDRLEQQLWLNEVLDTTARVLDDFSTIKLPVEQLEHKKREVDQLLRNNYTLLVIDNFETIKDPALESWLERIPYPSKVLITSRSKQLSRAWDIDLKGLDNPTALTFINNHAERFGLSSIKTANQDILRPLVDVTGGNPRAIELALGHIKRGLGLDEVVGYLHAARKSVNNVFDELFMRSWQNMTDNDRKILMVATFFADSMSKEALGAASGLTEYDLDKAVGNLVEFMLLDMKEGKAASGHRYSIHPLTRAFATMQLQDIPDFGGQARQRWSNYYLDFAAHSLERDQSIEHYLNALKRRDLEPVHLEWPNLNNVLVWADQTAQGQTFIGLMMLLIHYMERRLFYRERIDNARKAAVTAQKLGMYEQAALFYIDGLGWLLAQEDRLQDAEQEIHKGLRLVQTINSENSYALDLIALANAFLARIQLEQGNSAEASMLINKSIATVRSSTYRVRVNKIAGDIARKKGKYAEARKFYENVRHELSQEGKIGEIEGREVVNNRLGWIYLESGDIEQAEISFNSILADEQDDTIIGVVQTKYGLARVAQARGERDKARQLAQEAREALSHEITSHKLLNQIDKFLQSLEEN